MFGINKRKKTKDISSRVLPVHIGLIMDGNGRWAKKRGLPRQAGHVMGAKTFRSIAKYCNKIGIRYLTCYAFSTENWSRPKEEVDAIMNLLYEYLCEVHIHKDENIKIVFIGDRSVLDPKIRAKMEETEQSGSDASGMVLNIAINYGGRDEITNSVREIAAEVSSGKISVLDINEKTIEKHLYTSGQPPVDLIIRPSGEHRLSNFLIWQAAYAEYIFYDILWPDFKPKHIDMAVDEFSVRNRRFGGV